MEYNVKFIMLKDYEFYLREAISITKAKIDKKYKSVEVYFTNAHLFI